MGEGISGYPVEENNKLDSDRRYAVRRNGKDPQRINGGDYYLPVHQL